MEDGQIPNPGLNPAKVVFAPCLAIVVSGCLAKRVPNAFSVGSQSSSK